MQKVRLTRSSNRVRRVQGHFSPLSSRYVALMLTINLNVVPNKAAGSQIKTLLSSVIGLCDVILKNKYKRINCSQGEILLEYMLRGCETFFASGHHVTFDSVL